MGLFNWFKTEAPAIQADVAAAEQAAPAKAVNVVHAMLLELEAHEQAHPILLSFTEHVDQVIEADAGPLLLKIEQRVLGVLAGKYPVLAPLIPSLPAAVQPTAPTPAAAPAPAPAAAPAKK